MRKGKKLFLVVVSVLLLIAISASAQIYRYYTPGTIWTVTMVKMNSGMDAAYLQYLDTQLKKDHEAQIKAKYMKSYKILRSLDDDEGRQALAIERVALVPCRIDQPTPDGGRKCAVDDHGLAIDDRDGRQRRNGQAGRGLLDPFVQRLPDIGPIIWILP